MRADIDPKNSFSSLPRLAASTVVIGILAAISASHLMNDLLQALIPSMYPIVKQSFRLDYGQIGMIQFVYLITASILQPVVGMYTDRHPQPFSLAVGMAATLAGILFLSVASSYTQILAAAAVVGIGSSIFHPEASRVARMASGGRYGTAQSVFQVGGYAGTAIGPSLAARVVVPYGQASLAWFGLLAFCAIGLLVWIGLWARKRHREQKKAPAAAAVAAVALAPGKLRFIVTVLVLLVASKAFYMASMTSYFTLYLQATFHLGAREALDYLALFSGSVAFGTLIGGPIGDRIGRKAVIWFSILGVLPFTLLLPHANLFWTGVLAVVIGLILSSAFSAILVYAQELMPGKVGLIAGLFFGLSFGLGGIGAAVLGELADYKSIGFVYQICAYLPALGMLAVFLPNTRKVRR